jgi:hypothetical protein
VVQGAAVAAREVAIVVEDAAIADDAGLLLAVLVLHDPAPSLADLDLLPGRLVEPVHPLGDALSVLAIGEVGTKCAATGVRPVGVDALAAVAEDAGPSRGQPGQVGANDLLGIGRIGELQPLAREVKGDLAGMCSPYCRA